MDTRHTNGWAKSETEIMMMIMLKNAKAAQAGRPCPVAARVLERMEFQREVSGWISEALKEG